MSLDTIYTILGKWENVYIYEHTESVLLEGYVWMQIQIPSYVVA